VPDVASEVFPTGTSVVGSVATVVASTVGGTGVVSVTALADVATAPAAVGAVVADPVEQPANHKLTRSSPITIIFVFIFPKISNLLLIRFYNPTYRSVKLELS
jgi:hypothetical protein